MKEQFVPYEIALKLKEKGFDEFCISKYEENYLCQDEGFDVCLDDTWLTNTKFNRSNPKYCTAPLWQQVIDWLREKHNIDISIEPGGKPKMYAVFVNSNWIYENTKDRMLYSYPEARQAAIEHALTLI